MNFNVGDLVHVESSEKDAFYNDFKTYQGKVTGFERTGGCYINEKYFLQLEGQSELNLVRKAK
ncbi:MAG: hypothetical protein K0U20_09235 [Proteobacteria bacterium]|nr:hypothetical protein [Pseudomonadota bacterium]MCH9735764.1 hypothetical protein [Actinomycetes bacterium]